MKRLYTGKKTMDTLNQKATNAISKLLNMADIDEIMYRYYVIDKVRKGKEAMGRVETVLIGDLKREVESW